MIDQRIDTCLHLHKQGHLLFESIVLRSSPYKCERKVLTVIEGIISCQEPFLIILVGLQKNNPPRMYVCIHVNIYVNVPRIYIYIHSHIRSMHALLYILYR